MTLDHNAIAQEVEERFGAFFREKINPSAIFRDQTYSTFDEETLHEMGRLGLIGFTAAKSIGVRGRNGVTRWKKSATWQMIQASPCCSRIGKPLTTWSITLACKDGRT